MTASTALQAVRDVELPELVLAEGYPLHRQGRAWAGNTCPECGESSGESNKFNVHLAKDGRWRYKCFACDIYGDAADFIALSRRISLADAIKEINGEGRGLAIVRTSPAKRAPIEPAPSEQRILEVASIIRKDAHHDEVRAYLKKRSLDDATIDMAVASGQLRMLPTNAEGCRRWLVKHIGESLLREAGMLKGNTGWPALAFRPLIAIEPGGFGFECRVADFSYEGAKAIRYGRLKWPWYFSRKEKPATVAVTEGFIDCLSAWQMLGEAEAVMGIPGVNGWSERWFSKLLERRPDCTALIGFDEDEAGERGRGKLGAYLDSIGLSWMTIRPPRGKDWNEALTLTDSIWI